MYKREIDNSWNFKEANTKEYTHCYHIYPAMMIPQVARTLIKDFRPSGKCELLFDPYMGSGTSLVEASLANMNSVGTDLNPLARQFYAIQSRLFFFSYNDVKNKNFDRISNHTFWYSADSLLRLSYLSQLIDECSENKDFFNVALSEVVREASFTRNGEFKRFRMKEDKIKSYHPDVFGLFEEKVIRNIDGLEKYEQSVTNKTTAKGCHFSTLRRQPDNRRIRTILPLGKRMVHV